jgi:hypothetical protein
MTFNRASCGVEKLVKSQNITRKGEINSVNKASQRKPSPKGGKEWLECLRQWEA